MFISGIAASNQKAASAPVSGWDLSTATNDSVPFSVNSEQPQPMGIFIKPDGTKFYIAGPSNELHQYSMGTPWDMDTASYDSVSFDVSSESTSTEDLFFKSDGTKLYTCCRLTDAVYQYTLSTAWDLSTASYDSVSLSVSANENNIEDLHIKPDGTKLFIIGRASDQIYQYTMSTAWDLSTASYDSISFGVGSQQTGPHSFWFKPDGTKLYVNGAAPEAVHQYTLSTAWDLTTITYDSVSLDINPWDDPYGGMCWKPDGTKMYLVGTTADEVEQFSVS